MKRERVRRLGVAVLGSLLFLLLWNAGGGWFGETVTFEDRAERHSEIRIPESLPQGKDLDARLFPHDEDCPVISLAVPPESGCVWGNVVPAFGVVAGMKGHFELLFATLPKSRFRFSSSGYEVREFDVDGVTYGVQSLLYGLVAIRDVYCYCRSSSFPLERLRGTWRWARKR